MHIPRISSPRIMYAEMVLFFSHRKSILQVSVITSLTLVFFLRNFNFDSAADNSFYDADSIRTMMYGSDPRNAISSVRPFLVVISLLPFGLSHLFSNYISWTILNVFCIFIMVFVSSKLLRNLYHDNIFYILLLANFSTVVWIFVPDTFLLAMTVFLVAIYIYGEGINFIRVVLSLILASTLNVFLFLPWFLAHVIIQRKRIVFGLKTSCVGLGILTLLILPGQVLEKFKPTINPIPPISYELQQRMIHFLPLYDSTGPLGHIGSVAWFHSPFVGFNRNFLTFVCAPWIVDYRYQIERIAIDSKNFPYALIIPAALLTLLSFLGLGRLYKKSPVISLFCIGLEIGTAILFFTYSIHPFLFSPFLLFSRVLGLTEVSRNRGQLNYLVVLTVVALTCFTSILVFNR